MSLLPRMTWHILEEKLGSSSGITGAAGIVAMSRASRKPMQDEAEISTKKAAYGEDGEATGCPPSARSNQAVLHIESNRLYIGTIAFLFSQDGSRHEEEDGLP